jgi:predicted DsbA family dithiol-disulfide isomerase
MIKLKFKKEHKTHLLVGSALLVLLVVGTMYLFGQFLLFGKTFNNKAYVLKSQPQISSEDQGDPLMTVVPSSEKIITEPIIRPTDPVLGSEQAKISIVQFSDFACSFCKQQETVVQKLMKEYGNNIKFIWKDYPDNNSSSVSYQTTIAARCAQEQGKFWEYHNELFKNSAKLNQNLFGSIVQSLALDEDKFLECFNSSETKKLVDEDIKEGDALKITGVPFMYVNEQEAMGEVTYEDLVAMIKIEMNKNKDK